MTGVGWLLVWIACLAKIYSCVGDGVEANLPTECSGGTKCNALIIAGHGEGKGVRNFEGEWLEIKTNLGVHS